MEESASGVSIYLIAMLNICLKRKSVFTTYAYDDRRDLSQGQAIKRMAMLVSFFHSNLKLRRYQWLVALVDMIPHDLR